MNLYQRRILPRLIDLAMRNKEATRFRAQVVPEARGTTLEIGVGSGLNLALYGERVERLVAVDPPEELVRIARQRAPKAAFPIEFFVRPAEVLPLEDRSIDSIVMTFTLCSIADPLEALREMRRVLANPDIGFLALRLTMGAVLGAAAYLNWAWLIAVGIAPFLIALGPCAAMCALGLCMSRMGGKACPTESERRPTLRE